MAGHRKLGRRTDIRLSMLRGLVTTLIVNGSVRTTQARAKEVQKIAEKIITLAIKEKDNFTTKDVIVSKAKVDSKGRKVLKTKTSNSGSKYEVVEREMSTKSVKVDNPSRLAARKLTFRWLNKSHAADGSNVNPANKLFDEIAPRYVTRNGGYTRIVLLGTRRGDAAEMALLELV